MNRLIPGLFLAAILGVGATNASACPSGGKGDRVDRVAEKLELTTEQETRFREIMQAKRANMKIYHETQRTDTLNQLSGVLTADQLAKFEKMAERKSHHKKGK
tara:strand:- start:453 stop:761 length:309 start_codon:yes stop_codon:yes gene_type:complete